jgi:DNA replication protein DnaC
LTRKLAKTELLLLDDWALTTLTIDQAQDLLDVLEDRAGVGSTLIATQVPVSQWHARIGDPTIADAILDRLVHGAHRIELRGESMRKLRARAEAAERPEEARPEPKPADA